MPTRRALIASLVATSALAQPAPANAAALVAAARRQIGVTTGYDRAYRSLPYPGGDLPRETGVCADVIVRAARDAWRADLQRLVYEDMSRAFAAYPQRWGLRRPDRNIDHRRVPNLETYWTRAGARVWRAGARTPRPALLPGDILTWRDFRGAGPHVAVVSEGAPLPRVVHNRGAGTQEELLIFLWLDTAGSHFRWRPDRA